MVADLVYAPLETPLLAAARARGLAIADGLGMLLHQAVRGFQLWFGVRPEVTPQLRALVETDLAEIREYWPSGEGLLPAGAASRFQQQRRHKPDAISREDWHMQTMTRRALGVARLALMVTASAVWAQQAPPVRVRGEITKVEGNTLSVKSRSGENLTVKLAEPLRISAMVKSRRSPTSRRARSSACRPCRSRTARQKAYAIHIFMDSQKGVVADRFSEWDSRPGSTMTNANVATTVSGKDGQDLLVKYKDGEKKVIVPPGIPIAKYVPGSAADLKVGAKVFVGAREEAGRRLADRAQHRGRPRHRSAAMSGGRD